MHLTVWLVSLGEMSEITLSVKVIFSKLKLNIIFGSMVLLGVSGPVHPLEYRLKADVFFFSDLL